jgi:hypothetical protein
MFRLILVQPNALTVLLQAPRLPAGDEKQFSVNTVLLSGEQNVDLYIHSPIRLNGLVLNYLLTTYIQFSNYMFSGLFCVINPDYHLIRMTSPPKINPD